MGTENSILDQMKCPYFTVCPHFAGLLFTGFTVYVQYTLDENKGHKHEVYK
jgi:hypothetical protein